MDSRNRALGLSMVSKYLGRDRPVLFFIHRHAHAHYVKRGGVQT